MRNSKKMKGKYKNIKLKIKIRCSNDVKKQIDFPAEVFSLI